MQIDDTDVDERSISELCHIPPILGKNKAVKQLLGNYIDGWKRGFARKEAEAQDSLRRPVASTRYDVNNYSGGPTAIHDLGVVERRKVR